MVGGTTTRTIFLGVLAFDFVFWLIGLAGISAMQSQCPGSCRSTLGLGWWVIWLQFAVLIAAALYQLGKWSARAALLTLLAIVTTLAMVETNQYLNYRDGFGFENSRVNTAITGFLMFSILNTILIILLGTDMEAVATKAAPQMTATPAANYNTGAAAPTFTHPVATGPPGYPVQPPTTNVV